MKEAINATVKISVSTFVLLVLLSCSDLVDYADQSFRHDPISEDFNDDDKPSYETMAYDDDGTSRSYSLMLPWNYDKDYNSDREYPILINVKYMESFVAGDSDRMQDYPCFCLNGISYNSTWTYAMVAELVNTYRIDTDRIYLVGFSAGGSGSYPFASNLESYQGLTVAGIVRCAGGSNTELSDAISGKTSVWYHVGLADSYDFGYGNGLLSEEADDERRISNQAYAYAQSLDSSDGAIETVVTDTASNYERTTSALNLEGVEIFKKSHYADMGHTSYPAEADPDVVEWLFNQHLSNRY